MLNWLMFDSSQVTARSGGAVYPRHDSELLEYCKRKDDKKKGKIGGRFDKEALA